MSLPACLNRSTFDRRTSEWQLVSSRTGYMASWTASASIAHSTMVPTHSTVLPHFRRVVGTKASIATDWNLSSKPPTTWFPARTPSSCRSRIMIRSSGLNLVDRNALFQLGASATTLQPFSTFRRSFHGPSSNEVKEAEKGKVTTKFPKWPTLFFGTIILSQYYHWCMVKEANKNIAGTNKTNTEANNNIEDTDSCRLSF